MTDVFEVTVLDEVFELQESPGIEYRVMLSTGDPGGGTGDVVGPSSSTDGRAAEFDGTTGKLLREAPLTGAGGRPRLDGDGTWADSLIPATIARDSEVTAAVTAHAAAADPHGDRAYTDTGLASKVPTSRTLAGLDLSTDRTASALRTALSLVPGTDVQAYDADLGQIAAATFANDDFVQKKAGSLTNRTIAQVKADLGVVSPAHSQEAKYGASDTWGVPGDGYANFGSFSAAPNTFYPIPFVVNSTITVTAIAAAQTGGGTAGNMRLLIYAADVDWQASGAALLDTGSISTATNAVKSATGLSVVLTPGRYLRCFICDVAGLSYRVGAVSRTFLAPGIDGLATRWTGPVTYGAPSSPVWNGHIGNSTPTEMMIGMRWTV